MNTPGSQDWLDSITEDIIDPEQRIIDPHHHLWRHPGNEYVVENLHADTGSGHNIVKTVFVECHSEYLKDGPAHLRPLGETRFVAEQATESAERHGAEISGIVAHADLTLGDELVEVLAGHEVSGNGLFRGIRHAGACATHPKELFIPGGAPKGLYADQKFRAGVRLLGRKGYSYDTWHYHYQNKDFYELALAAPDTQMILDHFGTPLGVGYYADKKAGVFKQWKQDIKKIAECDNVIAKIGGLAMPDNGFGWHNRSTPPDSDEFVEAQRDYYLHTIDCFGPDRCMFESNFPVDRFSISYPVLYNGLKKIVVDFSEEEKDAMFYDTAERIYRLHGEADRNV
ncbi:MAG: amidohydrolase family protein [Pseudomonadales bacterium]|jgi:predicted TIM-barrel fold metal-dependent hydrolase